MERWFIPLSPRAFTEMFLSAAVIDYQSLLMFLLEARLSHKCIRKTAQLRDLIISANCTVGPGSLHHRFSKRKYPQTLEAIEPFQLERFDRMFTCSDFLLLQRFWNREAKT